MNQGVETGHTLDVLPVPLSRNGLSSVFVTDMIGKQPSTGGNMRNPEEVPAGPIWGVIAGILMVATGIGLGIASKLVNGAGNFDESLAISAVMFGVLLAVYAGHEMTRKKRH